MAVNFRRITDGIQIIPKTTSTASLAGEMDFDTTSNKLNLFGTISDHVVTETVAATLTNKTLAVSSNSITSTPNRAAQFNVSTGNLEASTVTDTELSYVSGVTSSIQTQLNNTQPAGNYISSLNGDVTATGPGAATATVVMVGGVSASNVASGANLANAATSLDTPSTIVLRDSSGNFAAGTITAAGVSSTSSADLIFSTLNNHNIQLSPNGSGLIISNSPLQISSNLRLVRSDDSTTTGSATTLSAFTTSYVKVTNSSLVSISGIPAGANGEVLTLTNGTGVNITINNNDGSITASNRILTGTGNTVPLNSNASVQLIYDTGSSIWRISDLPFTLGTNVVTNSNLAQIPAHTFLGNNTGSTANVIDLTATQLTAELNVFTPSLNGLVPASSGGTTTFLRADGTFTAPTIVATTTGAAVSGSFASVPPNNAIIYPTVIYDTASAYSSSTGQYTAPSTGLYLVTAFFDCTGNTIFAVNVNLNFRITMGLNNANGAGNGSVVVSVSAGDRISVVALNQSITSNGTDNNASFTLIH